MNGGAGGAGAATQAAATEEKPSAEVETSDNLVPEPLAVFARPDEGRWLIVSGIRVPEPEVYTARLREQHERLDTDQFLLQGIEVHQYRSFPKGMVNFRLLLAAPGRPDERRLQLDYVFPARDYAEMGRVLESSIGSIKPLRQAEG